MLEKLNQLEVQLINQFKLHPLFINLKTVPWNDFLSILIQRRFFSLCIVNVYEFVIDAIADPAIKQTVRGILNEEYPRNTKGIPLPSHRELLFQDLLNLGATEQMILTTPESTITKKIRKESYRLLNGCLDTNYPSVGLVTFLRFWAEVLVAIEYSCFWTRISEKLTHERTEKKKRSEFYYFHMIHDRRNSDIGKEKLLGGLTHSQELALHLKDIICSENALEYSLKMEKQVFELKYRFYDQFMQN